MATATAPVTYEEWIAMPENLESREECVNGVIEEVPPPKWKHTVVVERLTRQLWKKLDEATTMVVSSNFGLVIRTKPLTQRTPDIAVFVVDTMVERDGYIHSAPELAVEVLSPANTARRVRDKLADYASIGVSEVWVLNPVDSSVAVHRLTGGTYRSNVLSGGEAVVPRSFPSATIDFSAIWP